MALAQTLTFEGKLGEARELIEQVLRRAASAWRRRPRHDHGPRRAGDRAPDLHQYADAEAGAPRALERARRSTARTTSRRSRS
jgi:hypothetical protein